MCTTGTPYLTQECPFPKTVEGADSKYHFSLFYLPDLAENIDGTSRLPDPHGFSGSLVWDTKLVSCIQSGEQWNPNMAKVTGIVWGWPSSSGSILATKVEHMGHIQLIENERNNA